MKRADPSTHITLSFGDILALHDTSRHLGKFVLVVTLLVPHQMNLPR